MLGKKIIFYPNIKTVLMVSILSYISNNQEYIESLKHGRNHGIILDYKDVGTIMIYTTKTAVIVIS